LAQVVPSPRASAAVGPRPPRRLPPGKMEQRRASMAPALLATLLVTSAVTSVSGLTFGTPMAETPITQVVTLLGELKAKIESDGTAEQESYNKYACWCEDTLAAKAGDISSGMAAIQDLETLIVKLSGDLATHGVEIKQLEKDIAGNIESQREAGEVRGKESESYQEEKAETEQCIGALEAAIKVLAGAGTGKKGFLETLQEAQLLSVVAGVRGLLGRSTVARSVSDGDLQVVKHFVSRPQDFVGGRTGAISAAQIANNPFGDYAPQSTRVQGILKSMYDAVAGDLEKSNAEEAERQKAFEELMQTKKAELVTLQTTLERETMDEATKTKKLSDSRGDLDDTKAQLTADKTFFKESKASCKAKAGEWAERVRSRTEELHGISQAVTILSDPEAQRTFANATTTLLQISSSGSTASGGATGAYEHLRDLATRYQSVSLARLALRAQAAGGHFDKVIASIDQMIAVLREEEKSDIDERDWCQGKQSKNQFDKEDINAEIEKAKNTLTRWGDEAKDLLAKASALEGDINTTKSNMEELKEMRIQERTEFIQSVKDDTDAVALLEQAIVALTKFYRNNKISLALPQQTASNSSAPPETNWQPGKYTGSSQASGGIVAILGMIKEDLEKEVKMARLSDASAQKNYEADRGALKATLDAYMKSKAAVEMEHADLQLKITDLEAHQNRKGEELLAEDKVSESLLHNCGWVKTHFESRRDKRKSEIDGLVEAKNFLAGVDSGDDSIL